MSHTTPNNSSLHKRFLQATKYWISPDIRPDVAAFSDLWFGSNCALLQYTAETAGEFDDEAQTRLTDLLALQPHQHADAAKKWLRRANGNDPKVPNAEVDAHAPALTNSVIAIVHGMAAVCQWRESHWGSNTVAIEAAREHVKTCWRSYAKALPADGEPTMHGNLYLNALNPTKLSGLMALLNEPTTATHWLMLQRLFAFLLQNTPDAQSLLTRSASEATETISTEKTSLARRVSIPAKSEHEVRTHLVGVALHGETRPLTVSRVAEGPSGWYLDPVALGATRIAPEILKQLDLSWRIVRHEQTQPLRIAIPSDGLPSLTGPSAGGLLLLSMHAAATSGFLREDSTASFDIQPAREFQENERIRLSDITAILVEPSSVWKKAHSLTAIPPTNRLILAHNQTDNHTGKARAWETWTTAARAELHVECVPIKNAQEAWLQMSGGPQIEALRIYLEDLIRQSDKVPAYFPPGTDMPSIRVQVRMRTELFQPDDLRDKQNEIERRMGGDSDRRAYDHPLREDEVRRGEQTREVILDWDTQVRGVTQRALVLGDPGLGKSWLLWHEARALAQLAAEQLQKTGSIESVVLPIRVALADVAQSIQTLRRDDKPPDFRGALLHTLRLRHGATNDDLLDRVAVTLGTERCVLLFDAWDEVEKSLQQELHRCLKEWLDTHPNARVVITSRVVGRPKAFFSVARDFTRDRDLQLQPFGDAQIRDFIERFFTKSSPMAAALNSALPQAPQLRGLAQTPLLLSFLCRYAYDKMDARASAPTLDLCHLHRNDLYRYVVTQFLNGVWNPNLQALDDTEVSRQLPILAQTAYLLLKNGYQRFSLADFEKHLATALRDSAHGFTVTRTEFELLLRQLVNLSGLIVPNGVGADANYLFLHLTFQEYLAARHLQSLKWRELEPILTKLWDHPDWQEVWDLLVRENSGDPQQIERMVATILQNGHPLDEHLQRHCITALRWMVITGIEPTAKTPNCEHCLNLMLDPLNQRRSQFLFNDLLYNIRRTPGRVQG